MFPYVIHLEREDGYDLSRNYILVFAYSPREAMFNAGAQAALLGCTKFIGLDRTSLEKGNVIYVAADGLETTLYDIHDGEFWEVFEQEVSNWGEQLSSFAGSYSGDARNFKKIGLKAGYKELFMTEPALAEFNAEVEAYEIEQELPLKSKRKSKSI